MDAILKETQNSEEKAHLNKSRLPDELLAKQEQIEAQRVMKEGKSMEISIEDLLDLLLKK